MLLCRLKNKDFRNKMKNYSLGWLWLGALLGAWITKFVIGKHYW